MIRIASALVIGLIFGLGLTISQMIDPAKVLGFLDVAGSWDPSLAFVMGGALLVTIPGFRMVLPRSAPILNSHFHLPTKRDLDARLLAGAAIFGAGWGIAGMCPGPAITALGLGYGDVAWCVAGIVAGMTLNRLLNQRLHHA